MAFSGKKVFTLIWLRILRKYDRRLLWPDTTLLSLMHRPVTDRLNLKKVPRFRSLCEPHVTMPELNRPPLTSPHTTTRRGPTDWRILQSICPLIRSMREVGVDTTTLMVHWCRKTEIPTASSTQLKLFPETTRLLFKLLLPGVITSTSPGIS